MQHHNKIGFLKILSNLIMVLAVLFSIDAHGQGLDNYTIRTVVIDAGHGGKDPGALGKNCTEKEITLILAKKLEKLIAENFPEIKVAQTRLKDTFIDLRDRPKYANAQGADLFISIHCNSFPKNRNVCGIETYVMGLHKSNENLNVAMRENAVITYEDNFESKYEGYDPNSQESFIIFSMLQNAFLEQSLSFASMVQNEMLQNTPLYDRGVRQAGFWVLVGTSMPSILVEVGYISNAKDEAYMRSEKGQNDIALSIFNAFKSYKQHIDHKNSTTSSKHFTAQKPVTGGVIYKIQLHVSSKPITISKTKLKNIKNVEEIQVNDKFKYCTGSSSSYQETLNNLQEIKKVIPDAFIIAFKDGIQISAQDALKQQQ